MIPVHEAQQIVLSTVTLLADVKVPLEEAVDRVLAENVVSDRDLPPFDKSAMDGYAVRSEDVATLPVELEVIESIPAGKSPERVVGPGQASQIMTGAPVPEGADTIAIVERTEPGDSEGSIRILEAPPAGSNICRQGEDIASGTLSLEAGIRIRPAEVAVLATLGRDRVVVHRRPSVAVLTTGDEIVDVGDQPEGAQIRDSNSHAVASRLRRLGIVVTRLGIAPDQPEDLKRAIEAGLQHDLLIMSGGVSAGILDLVPSMLEVCGVELLFQKVKLKPGKPTVFGRHSKGFVFGLPGNPVSVLVTLELFVIPAVKAMMGHRAPLPTDLPAILAEDVRHRADRPFYRPIRLATDGDRLVAQPVLFQGSGDLIGLTRADALACLPEDVPELAAGTPVRVFRPDW